MMRILLVLMGSDEKSVGNVVRDDKIVGDDGKS